MRTRFQSLILAGIACLALLSPLSATADAAKLDNAGCLSCHDSSKKKIEVPGTDGSRELAHVNAVKFAKGMHSDMQCVDCHKEITDSQANHVKAANVDPPACVSCHEAIWETVKKEGLTEQKERLGDVVRSVEAYRNSFHAQPDKDEPSRVMASCEDCHSSHEFNVPPRGTARRTAWHKEIPNTCANCHEDQLEAYEASIHGEEVLEKGNINAAVCTDCHSAHSVVGTGTVGFKLDAVQSCGSCHEAELNSYADTYHGKVNRLGYAYTAKCSDCHESHRILPADHPKSAVHPQNRLKTCQTCHNDKRPGMRTATAGFSTFAPHANTHDFEKYPQMYVASKLMIGLLIFVFAFFWAHSGLWYYREWKDRKEGKARPLIDTKGLVLDKTKHFQRFHWGWRVAHLLFAIATMILVLSGITALFAGSSWAPWIASVAGGPANLGLIHRVAATVFLVIFVIHFFYVMQKLLRDRTFRWFGPDSLLPTWKDWHDLVGMFRWFFGKGPRPRFERWAYYEKFDYWAVFWGVAVIGGSGLTLAFPHIVAQYLPGWIFNVATLVHGEEAFLAAVFLFTVHFFNNHFRPDKLPPPDVAMFTGTQSLDEFRHDHAAQYQRLLESGELEKYLVDPPSKALHTGSVILGLALIALGLILLVLVAIGFFGG